MPERTVATPRSLKELGFKKSIAVNGVPYTLLLEAYYRHVPGNAARQGWKSSRQDIQRWQGVLGLLCWYRRYTFILDIKGGASVAQDRCLAFFAYTCTCSSYIYKNYTVMPLAARTKRTLIVGIPAVVLVALFWGISFLNSIIPIVTGYSAKHLCSSVFISEPSAAGC